MTPQLSNTALALANSKALSSPLATSAKAAALKATAGQEKAKAAAQDFEAVFINTLFQQMFASIGQGPFSGGPAAGVWRSMLTDQYAKTFAKAGGLGIASHVQSALMAQQEAR